MLPILIATATPGFGKGTGGRNGGQQRLLRSLVLLVPFLSATGGETSYVRVFKGSCPHVDAMALMYRGGGDNEGSTEDQATACATSCAARDKPLEYNCNNECNRLTSWWDYVAKGFILEEGGVHAGRCWCQMDDSATCTRTIDEYYRYDILDSSTTRATGGTSSLSLITSVSQHRRSGGHASDLG